MVKKKEEKKELTLFDKINNFMDKIVDWFKAILNDEHSDKVIANIAIKIIVGFILLSIIKVLFLIIKGIGAVFISFIFSPLDNIILFLWSMIIEVSLFIIAVLIIVAIVKNIIELSPSKEKVTPKKKKDKVIIEEEVKSEKVVTKKEVTGNDKIMLSIVSVLMIIVKVLTILAIIPFIFLNIALFIALGILVSLAINGILLMGAICIIVGTILIFSAFSGMITHLVFKGGNK